MKTFQILFLTLFLSASLAMAQDTLYVYKAGAVAYKSVIATVDSITFQKVYPPAPTTVTDFDGNVYQTVVIGTQTWMVENLKTTHYRNGDPITNITDNTAWVNTYSGFIGAWCDYANNAANGTKYGHLYNWYAVANVANLAPAGWHIPSPAEWTTLSNYLGGTYAAGGELKEAGIVNWVTPNTGATNSSGFTALPGGYRGASDGVFGGIGTSAQFWTSTGNQAGDYMGTYYYLLNTDGYFVPTSNYVTFGFSVRCIKD